MPQKRRAKPAVFVCVYHNQYRKYTTKLKGGVHD